MVYVVLVKSQYKRRSAIIDASLSSVIVYSSLVTILKLIDITWSELCIRHLIKKMKKKTTATSAWNSEAIKATIGNLLNFLTALQKW